MVFVAVTTAPDACILDAVIESIISTSCTVASLTKISSFSLLISYKLPKDNCPNLGTMIKLVKSGANSFIT